jgi:hypothetical protein
MQRSPCCEQKADALADLQTFSKRRSHGANFGAEIHVFLGGRYGAFTFHRLLLLGGQLIEGGLTSPSLRIVAMVLSVKKGSMVFGSSKILGAASVSAPPDELGEKWPHRRQN